MGLVEAWGGNSIGWFFAHIIEAFYNFFYAISHPGLWLDWLTWANTTEDKQSLMRFVYYGGSVELFFVLLVMVLIATGIGIWRKDIMWGYVRGLESVANAIGRVAAWAGLLMVLQQTIIIFMQRIFAVSELSFGLGVAFTKDISWWSEELKLYNAMIVALCVSYTFVQGSHVRVDLVYDRVSFRTKRIIDMVGSLVFMVPAAVLTWMYGWFFLWRHLIVPKPSASDKIERLIAKSRALRWNVETIGFSPNGFNAYFLFKILLVTFTALVFLQAIAFFYRSYLEYVEGESSEGKNLDKDWLGEGEEPFDHAHQE